MSFRWSESKVLDAVVQHKYAEPWLTMRQFRPGAGTGQWAEKSFDCFCFHPWPSESYARHVLEAKISRSDFLKEMKDPLKRRAGLYCATKFWYVCSPGCVRDLDEIPINCGYMEVDIDDEGRYSCEVLVPAPELVDEPPTWNFLAGAVRRVLGLDDVKNVQVDLGALASAQAELVKSQMECDSLRTKLVAAERKLEILGKAIRNGK